MEFNQEAHINLDSLFHKYNFEVIEETKNYLQLKSPFLVIILVYDPGERSNNIYIITSSSSSRTIGLDNEIFKDFFKSNLRLSSTDVKKFVDTLAKFFENEGKLILQGDIKEIVRLEMYSSLRDKIYTDKFK